jgi:predicted ATPase
MINGKYINKIRYKCGIDNSSYLNDLYIVKYLASNKELVFDNDVTFVIGENGTGKSTLVEAIAVCAGFNAEGGTKNFNFSTRNTVSELSKHITIIKSAFPRDGFFLRAESFYNVATDIDDTGVTGYGNCSLHEQSHGESFLALFQNRFKGDGLYILDEPEAALSPSRQMTLLAEINSLVKQNSQFIIATHSPILLAYPNATIYEITSENINKVSYEECEHYRLYKQFLERPKQMLRYLFEE